MNHTETLNLLPQLAAQAVSPMLANLPRAALQSPGGTGYKILIVRDHPYVLEMLARILGDLDAKVQILDSTSALAAGAGASLDASPTRSPECGLTGRQMQVLECMVQGLPNKLICRRLSISPGTVKNHVSAILRALNVENRTQAVMAAARLGFTVSPAADRYAATRTNQRI
jgi:DNA-binding CsgD family transcriptional regulator